MRHWQGLLVGLLIGLLLGCTSDQTVRSTAWLDRFRRGATPSGPDVVMMDVALLERPVGDAYINRELWAWADEQVVALENRALLEDNGFRIAQVGGITPAKLQALLTSERSCANPRRLTLHADQPTRLVLGPAVPVCQFDFVEQEKRIPVSLEHAQCTLEVVPTLTRDGRTTLRFLPEVQHGEAPMLPRPTADRTAWMVQQDQPAEKYPALAWDVTLPPNEYVVVGARYDRPQTLGHRCFIRPDEATPVQRLLVIRTGRSAPGVDSLAPLTEDDSAVAPSLACQAPSTAIRPTARGTSP